MEYKANDATPQRPEGNRLLNAPLVEMDLIALIEQLKGEVSWKDSDRNSITLFKSDSLRIVLMGLHQNAALKPHRSNGVLSVQVLEGLIEVLTDKQNSKLKKGQMVALQNNIPYSIIALTSSFFLLTLAIEEKEEFTFD
ncbi:hypothetical protein QRD02_12020 [Aequorivita sp. SDUM287046]|uniref:Cupin domain-containing protein n=1 Tax=Aequorivita aurantiaca TaxID=3053356 RepID=A0ABT8DJB1_9FLAO|nr:hypothetical protein [Aequorivita aurantiaca]MDN3725113.1 hypothetical protein [Aequorivita aurantiaca]